MEWTTHQTIAVSTTEAGGLFQGTGRFKTFLENVLHYKQKMYNGEKSKYDRSVFCFKFVFFFSEGIVQSNLVWSGIC